MALSDGSLSEKTFTLSASRSIVYILAFVVMLVLVRVLSKTDYGTYRQLILLVNTLKTLLIIGIPTSLLFFYKVFKEEERNFLISQTLVYLSIAGFIALTILVGLKGFIAVYFNNPILEVLIPYISIYAFLLIASSFFELLLVAEDKIKKAFAIDILFSVSMTALLLGFLFVSRTVEALVYGLVAFGVFRFAISIAYIVRHYKISFDNVRSKYLSSQIKYSTSIGIALILSSYIVLVDKYFISMFFSPDTLAIYSVGAFEIPFVSLLVATVGHITLPKFTEKHKTKLYGEAAALFKESIRKLSLLFFPLTVLALLVAHEFIVLFFTPAYVESVPVFYLYILRIPLYVIVYTSLLMAFNKARSVLKISLAVLVSSILLSYILIFYIGILGPAIGVLLSVLLGAVIGVWETKKTLQKHIYDIIPLRIMFGILSLSIAIGLSILVMLILANIQDVLYLVFSSILYSVIYLFLARKTGLLKNSDIISIKKIFNKFIEA